MENDEPELKETGDENAENNLENATEGKKDESYGGFGGDDGFTYPSRKTRGKRAFKLTTKAVAFCAVSTALVFVGTIIGYSGSAFYFNLGDAVILIIAALFNPVISMIAGGLGAFLGDLLMYPATMLFTLVIKSVEGLLAGVLFYLINRNFKNKVINLDRNDDGDVKKFRTQYILKIVFSCLASLAAVLFMAIGYFISQTFFYGDVKTALVALPFDITQGLISLAVANLALYALKLDNFREKLRID